MLTLARDLVPRIQGGQGMRTAFERLAVLSCLPIAFPRTQISIRTDAGWLSSSPSSKPFSAVVEQAAQDKVGRYEVPRRDIATVKKIANPLKIGIMHDAAFVLGREWPDLLTRKAGTRAEVTVAPAARLDRRGAAWPPEQVQNLLIACYAVQADKAWLRAGHPVETPKLDKVPDDLVLRSQELPTQEEFDIASARAAGIFRHPAAAGAHRPVGARARRRHLAATPRAVWTRPRTLAAELDRHAATLGLDDDADRQATLAWCDPLLVRLAATTDDTQTVRVLAAADLPRDNAFYYAHLDSAERLTVRAAPGELAGARRPCRRDGDADGRP